MPAMKVNSTPTRTIWPVAEVRAVEIIDQTALPHDYRTIRLSTLDDAAHAIRSMQVRGGPTYREAQLCMEMVADTGRLASLDIVELNPALDVRNRTAELAVDLIESLFGKSTLMRTPSAKSSPRCHPRRAPKRRGRKRT